VNYYFYDIAKSTHSRINRVGDAKEYLFVLEVKEEGVEVGA